MLCFQGLVVHSSMQYVHLHAGLESDFVFVVFVSFFPLCLDFSSESTLSTSSSNFPGNWKRNCSGNSKSSGTTFLIVSMCAFSVLTSSSKCFSVFTFPSSVPNFSSSVLLNSVFNLLNIPQIFFCSATLVSSLLTLFSRCSSIYRTLTFVFLSDSTSFSSFLTLLNSSSFGNPPPPLRPRCARSLRLYALRRGVSRWPPASTWRMRSRSDRRSDRMLLYPSHRKKAATAPAGCCSVCVKAVAIHSCDPPRLEWTPLESPVPSKPNSCFIQRIIQRKQGNKSITHRRAPGAARRSAARGARGESASS